MAYTIHYKRFEDDEKKVAPGRVVQMFESSRQKIERSELETSEFDESIDRTAITHKAKGAIESYNANNPKHVDAFKARIDARNRIREVYTEVERRAIMEVVRSCRTLIQGILACKDPSGSDKNNIEDQRTQLVGALKKVLAYEEGHRRAWEWNPATNTDGGRSSSSSSSSSLGAIGYMIDDLQTCVPYFRHNSEGINIARHHDRNLRHIAMIVTDHLSVLSFCSGMGTDLQALHDNGLGRSLVRYVSFENDEACKKQLRRAAKRNGCLDKIVLLDDVWQPANAAGETLENRLWDLDIRDPFSLIFFSTPCQDSCGCNRTRNLDEPHRDKVRQRAIELTAPFRSIFSPEPVKCPEPGLAYAAPSVIQQLGGLLVSEFVKATKEGGVCNDDALGIRASLLCPCDHFGYPIRRQRLFHTELTMASSLCDRLEEEEEEEDDVPRIRPPTTLTEIFRTVAATCERCEDAEKDSEEEDAEEDASRPAPVWQSMQCVAPTFK